MKQVNFVAYLKKHLDRLSQEQVIEKFSGQLEKNTERIPGHFKEKDVHDWRVDYKKLRAYLRMITASVPGHMPHMTKEFKKIYKSAGSIRELQLYLELIKSLPGNNIEKIPVYNSLLQKQLFAAKEEFIKRTDIFSFEKELARWLVMPPDYLTVDIVKKFLQHRITAMRLIMLSPDSDKSLHSLRKHLKDIIYNIRVFTVNWGIPFPVIAWKSEKKLNELADELGNYNDRCTILNFVQSDYIDQLPADEKDIILDLNTQWLREKKEQQEQIIMKLKDLQLLPVVKVI